MTLPRNHAYRDRIYSFTLKLWLGTIKIIPQLAIKGQALTDLYNEYALSNVKGILNCLYVVKYMFRTDDQFVPLINGTPVDQPINRVPGYSTAWVPGCVITIRLSNGLPGCSTGLIRLFNGLSSCLTALARLLNGTNPIVQWDISAVPAC